jgi:hypothetical protein
MQKSALSLRRLLSDGSAGVLGVVVDMVRKVVIF